MTENTDSTTSEPTVPSPPPGGSGASLEDLERWKASIRRELEQARDETRHADQQEIEQLRGEITRLTEALQKANEWIEKREKEQSERTAVKGDQSTMVVPPHQLQPPQPVVEPANAGSGEGRENKKRGLGWW